MALKLGKGSFKACDGTAGWTDWRSDSRVVSSNPAWRDKGADMHACSEIAPSFRLAPQHSRYRIPYLYGSTQLVLSSMQLASLFCSELL